MKRSSLIVPLVVLLAGPNTGAADEAAPRPLTAADATAGKALYLQECAACHNIDPLARNGERYACTNPSCGNVDHADTNASKIVLARGLNVLAVDPTVTVCGDAGARGRSKKQKLRVVRRGTRRNGEVKALPFTAG